MFLYFFRKFQDVNCMALFDELLTGENKSENEFTVLFSAV